MIKKVRDFLLFSNLFVAFSATCLTISSCLLLDLRIFFFLLVFVFSSTLFSYNFSRLYTILKTEITAVPDRIKWGRSNKKVLFVLMGLSLLMTLVSYYYLKREVQYLALVLGGVSILYTLPIKRLRLREFGLIKILTIGLSWSLVTVLMPVLNEMEFELKNLILIVGNVLYIIAITIPFDIRDMNADIKANIKTLPHYIGIEKSNQILLVFFSIYTAIVIYIAFQYKTPYLAIAQCLFFFVANLILTFKQRFKDDIYCLLFIDGLPIIQLFFFVIALVLYDKLTLIKSLVFISNF